MIAAALWHLGATVNWIPVTPPKRRNTLTVETATHWADINRPGDSHERPHTQEEFIDAMAKKHNLRLRKSRL
jgi:hypothetical protein